MLLDPTPEKKQTLLWVSLGLGFIALLVLLGPILTPFAAAGILAYALNPAVDRFEAHGFGKFGMPRALAVVIVLLFFVAALLLLILIVVPVLQKQIPLLRDQIPISLARLNAVIAPYLEDAGVNLRLDSEGIRQMLTEYFEAGGDDLWRRILASATVGGAAVLGWVVTLLLVPIALFYLLLDWHVLLRRIENLVPRRWVGKVMELANEVDSLLAQYLRGQLAVMLVLSVYYSAALALAGFNVALPVGIITGLLVFIPYVGFGLGLVLALLAALLQFEGFEGLIWVGAIYGFGQVVESFFLTPRLVGERIGLHPLTVIFALLAFGHLFGFVGVLLALPASAILSVAMRHLRVHYFNSRFYNQS